MKFASGVRAGGPAIVGGLMAAMLLLGACDAEESTPANDSNENTEVEDEVAVEDEDEVEGDLDQFGTGDCLVFSGPNEEVVDPASCTDPGAYQVLLRVDGTIDEEACYDTEYSYILTSEGVSDFILCIAEVE